MSTKKTATKDVDETKTSNTKKKTKVTTIPKEWKEESKDIGSTDLEKGKRRSLISAIKRSITIKSDQPESTTSEPMNIVITLSPAKHLDIIEYLNENVAPGGRAEWARDSMRLKMRIERGVYGLNTESEGRGKETEETLQTVFGQFAEVMTKVMTDLKSGQTQYTEPLSSSTTTRPRIAPTSIEPPITRGGPPQLKKIETDKPKEELKPDRPSLDDAIGAIIVVE